MTSQAAPIEALRASLPRVDPKHLVTFLITLILVLGEWRYGILGGYERLAVALLTCLVAEAVLSRVIRGKMAALSSAYISGISLSLLIKPQPGLLWPFLLGGFLAIASKYVLTYRGRHLFNPSNFAIGVLLLGTPGSVAILSHQWGNELATNAVIWGFGLLIAYRARVLHVTAAYVVSFLVLAAVRHLIVGGPLAAEVAPLLGPMYQLFIFFMITDPRTTVSTKRGRVIVAALVALVETLIRLAGDFQIGWLSPLFPSPPILALFLVGPVALAIDLYRKSPAESPASRAAPRPAAPV